MKLKDLKTLSPKQLRTLGKLADALPALATEIDFLASQDMGCVL